jgi:hypothetical protein
MNINLNNILTLSALANGSHFIIQGVTGLGVADIRTSSFLFSGRSGGVVTDQLLGFRIITINGIIGENDGTPQQHAADRAALIAALPIGTTIPVYITNFAGETYRIDANVTDAKVEYRQRGVTSDFLIQLTASDPLFYSTDGGDIQTATITLQAQTGGYVTPYDLPVDWAAGAAPSTVLNSGNATVFPVIELHDESHNPIITNETTGETFALDISTADGDVIVIDMANRTVTLNGSNIMGNRTDDSTWWGLTPGDNSIVLTSATSDDSVYAELQWRNGVTGI